MSFFVNFPLFCIVGGLLCSVISSMLPARGARILSLTLTATVCTACLLLLYYVNQTGEAVTYLMGHYPHPWGNELRFGRLEPLYGAAFSAVMLLCILGGKKQLAHDLRPSKQNLYYVLCDLVLTALLALAFTNDVFTGYVFIEICTLASCGLLMIRQLGRTTLASVRYMIFSLLGSGLFLLGIVMLYEMTGHLLMPNLRETIAQLWQSGRYHTALTASICLITIGLAVKSGLFPFHFWMPDTYGCATPCSSGILSGLVSKGYIFLLLKLIFNVFGEQVFYACGVQNVLYGLGVAAMVVGSVSAILENDIFRMIAFSSAAQIGYIFMGIGISPELGVQASLLHILTHALTKPLLFLSAAQLSDAMGGRKRFRELQGAAFANPIAGAAFAVGSFSMIGLPLTVGMISKYLFAEAAFLSGVRMIPTLLVLAVSTVLNAFYFTRTLIRIYNRPTQALPTHVTLRQQPSYALAAAAFSVMILALGIAAQPVVTLLRRGLELF